MKTKILLLQEIEKFQEALEELKEKGEEVYGLDLSNAEQSLEEIEEMADYENDKEIDSTKIFNLVIKELDLEALEKIFTLNGELREQDEEFWKMIFGELSDEEDIEKYRNEIEVFYYWFSKYKKEKEKEKDKNKEEITVHQKLYDDISEMVNDCKKTLYKILDARDLNKKIDIINKMGKSLSLEERETIRFAQELLEEYTNNNNKELKKDNELKVEKLKRNVLVKKIKNLANEELNKQLNKTRSLQTEKIKEVLKLDFWKNKDVGYLQSVIDFEKNLREKQILDNELLIEIKKQLKNVSNEKIKNGYSLGSLDLKVQIKSFNIKEQALKNEYHKNMNSLKKESYADLKTLINKLDVEEKGLSKNAIKLDINQSK